MHDVAAPVDEIDDDLQQDLDEVSEFGDENPSGGSCVLAREV